MKTHVIIESNRVVKLGDPSVIAFEVEKMQAAHKLASSSGAFTVPEVIEFDANAGRLTMTRLQGLFPLRGIAGCDEAELDIYRRAGSALAIIHQGLSMPESLRRCLPRRLYGSAYPCWVHGDYTKTNVGVLPSSDAAQLAIIDWQLSDMYGGNANYGTACFDLAWFVSGLFMEPPHRHLGHWNMQCKARSFLQGYFSEARGILSLSDLIGYSGKLLTCRRKEFAMHARTVKRLLLNPGLWHWARFLERLERRGLDGAGR